MWYFHLSHIHDSLRVFIWKFLKFHPFNITTLQQYSPFNLIYLWVTLLFSVRFISLYVLHFLQWNPNFHKLPSLPQSVISKLFFMTTTILIYIPWSLFPFPELAYWRSFLDLVHWPTDNWNSKLFLNFLHFYSKNLPIYELSVVTMWLLNEVFFSSVFLMSRNVYLFWRLFSYSITLTGFIPSLN